MFTLQLKKKRPTKTIKFAEKNTAYNKLEIETLMHTLQTIVFYDNRIRTKKSNNNNFDLAMY